MTQKYRRKPVEIEAIQFTQEMYEKLLLIPKNPKENPIKVKLDFFQDADFYWNWSINRLEINMELAVFPSNYITRDLNGKFSVYSESVFNKTYDQVENES